MSPRGQGDDENTIIMKNGWLVVEIGPSGIINLQTTMGVNCFPDGVPGNQLLLFVDGGSIYRFGNEIPCITTSFNDSGEVFQMTSMSYETGPLRATTLVNGSLGGVPFQIRYDLQDRERSLRVSVTGSAPSGHSVMSYFRFNKTPESLTYGTTSHWDTEEPRNYFDTWKPPTPLTFEPTHDFVAVNAADGYAGAIYHSATPAWGIYNGGVAGCILRNTPGTQNATCATDPGTYTITYAVEPPDLLKPPAEGADGASLFGQALNFNTPLVGVPVTGTGQLPQMLSLVTPSDTRVLITALKAGTLDPQQLIVRFYQPTNGKIEDVVVNISSLIAGAYRDGSYLVAVAANALEQPSPQNLNIITAPSTLTLNLPLAITTVALGLQGV
jgi:alpha-mannosidase